MCPHESCCPFTSPRKTNTHSGVSKRVQERRKWLYARFALHYLLDNHEIFLWRSPLTEPSSQLSDRLSSSFPSDSVRSRAMLSFGHTWLISSSVNTTSQLESHRTNQRDKGNLSASCGPHETSHLTWAGPACLLQWKWIPSRSQWDPSSRLQSHNYSCRSGNDTRRQRLKVFVYAALKCTQCFRARQNDSSRNKVKLLSEQNALKTYTGVGKTPMRPVWCTNPGRKPARWALHTLPLSNILWMLLRFDFTRNVLIALREIWSSNVYNTAPLRSL